MPRRMPDSSSLRKRSSLSIAASNQQVPVPALLLGMVHRDIGLMQRGLSRLFAVRIAAVNAGGDRGLKLTIIVVDGSRNLGNQTVNQPINLPWPGWIKGDYAGEFIASDASHQGIAGQTDVEAAGGFDQHPVTS
jgi:hypothetical protein